jgi:hypothetical protein
MNVPSHFLNLTNGLEWADEVHSPSLLRIESTAIEKGDMWRVLRDLDVSFLMSVAVGNDVHVYDCGTRRRNSKTITIGVPFIREALIDFWTGRSPSLRTIAAKEAGRKIGYFKRYYCGIVSITGHSRATEHDGDVAFYRERLLRFAGVTQ